MATLAVALLACSEDQEDGSPRRGPEEKTRLEQCVSDEETHVHRIVSDFEDGSTSGVFDSIQRKYGDQSFEVDLAHELYAFLASNGYGRDPAVVDEATRRAMAACREVYGS